MKRYFDVHFKIYDDCKEGYSVFVIAENESIAVAKVLEDGLYECREDIDNIDYVGEIAEVDYYNAVKN